MIAFQIETEFQDFKGKRINVKQPIFRYDCKDNNFIFPCTNTVKGY